MIANKRAGRAVATYAVLVVVPAAVAVVALLSRGSGFA